MGARAERRQPGGVVWEWATAGAIAAAAIGFALHNGMEVGISNHCQYLLHGLQEADSSFLLGDWFVHETPDHHYLFSALVRALSRTGMIEVGLGLLNAAASVAFSIALYFIVARFASRPAAPFAAVMALIAFMPINGPGHSNILLPYFVPSVFAGVCLLVSFALLLHRRTLAAGIVAAIGCAMHANYLILVGAIWMIVIAMTPRNERAGSARRLLLPLLAAWFPNIRMIGLVAMDMSHAAEARRVFWDVYAPLHYRPGTWRVRELLDYAMTVGAGLAAALAAPRGYFTLEAKRIVTAVAVVLGGGVVASAALDIDLFTALFPWRLAPFLSIAALVCVGLLCDWESRFFGWRGVGIGVAFVLVLVASLRDERGVVVCAAIFALVRLMRMAAKSWRVNRVGMRRMQLAVCIVLLCCMGAWGVRSGVWRRDMFRKRLPAARASLFEWSRDNSRAGDVFAIPPDLIDFRLETGRAIIVDYKSFPLIPSDQLEWLRRQEIQAGGPVTGIDNAVARYATMDFRRARTLQKQFGISYLVTDRRRQQGDLSALRCVFQNDVYQVHELDRPSMVDDRFCDGADSTPPSRRRHKES